MPATGTTQLSQTEACFSSSVSQDEIDDDVLLRSVPSGTALVQGPASSHGAGSLRVNARPHADETGATDADSPARNALAARSTASFVKPAVAPCEAPHRRTAAARAPAPAAAQAARSLIGPRMVEPIEHYQDLLSRAHLAFDVEELPKVFLSQADAWTVCTLRYLVLP